MILPADSQLQGLAGVVREILYSGRECIDRKLTDNRKQFTKQIREVKKMKEGIHPKYYQATVTCNCGNTFVTGSTKEDIHVEVCSKCHSFYTGQQKATAARGRIDKFNRKYGIASK